MRHFTLTLTILSYAVVVTSISSDMLMNYWIAGFNGHAPIVMAAVLYGTWQAHPQDAEPSAADRRIGYLCLLLGWLLYFLGKAQVFDQLEAAAFLFLYPAFVLLTGGRDYYRRVRFFHAILLLALPLPTTIADGVLVPLKLLVSHFVVNACLLFGLPVAISGVVITVGFNQLLLADACSGLWAFLSLVTVGLLLVYFMPLGGRRRTLLFLFLIPVISLFANCLRLFFLVFVTHEYGMRGEAAVHDYAAMGELIVSITLFWLAHMVILLPSGAKAAER